jgi:L,D-peptidoglycan transpeptidase YkuD (ErfK/YbiS/YcfS/YnhG family)
MQELKLNLGNTGLTINNGKIAINHANNSLIKLGSDGGLYVANLKGEDGISSGSSCDGHTIVEKSSGGTIRPTTNQEKIYHIYAQNGGIYQNNRSVQHIYAIGAYQVQDHWIDWTNQKKTRVFSMDTSKLKSASDIVNEFNYAQEIMGLPTAPYYLLRGDLLVFKNTANAYYDIANVYKDLEITDEAYVKIFDNDRGKIQTWEDMNRYLINPSTGDGSKVLALFSIDRALYVPMNPRLRNRDSLLLAYLKITCLWSNLSAITKGTTLEFDKGLDIPEPTDDPVPPSDDPTVVIHDFDNGWKEVIDDQQHIDENGNLDPYLDENNKGNSDAKTETITPQKETTPVAEIVGVVYIASDNRILLADTVKDNPLDTHSISQLQFTSSGDNLIYSYGGTTYTFNKNSTFRMLEDPNDINSGCGAEMKWISGAASNRTGVTKGEFEVISSAYAFEVMPSGETEESESDKIDGPAIDDTHYTYGLPYESWSTVVSNLDTGGVDASTFFRDKSGNYQSRSSFISQYATFVEEIDLREQQLAEYIQQAHLMAAIAGISSGSSTETVNSTGGVVDAIITVLLATKHTGGFVTYCMGGSRTLDIEGVTLHGRIDCTGLIMFVVGLLGYRKYKGDKSNGHGGFSVSNFQSTQMCNTKYVKDLCGNTVSTTDPNDTSGKDFLILTNPSVDELQAGDFVAYPGHGQIFGILQDGRQYGWNWGCTNAITTTYKSAELARDGTDPLAACVSAGTSLGSKAYHVAYRYIGGGTGEETNIIQTSANASGNLQKMINESGVTVSGLGTQLVVVKSSDTTCTVYFFEKSGSTWTLKNSCNGYVGSKGVGTTREGVSITPKGLWGLGIGDGGVSNEITAFGFHTADSSWKSGLKSKYKDISSGTHYWGGSQNRYSSSYVSGEQISKYKTAYEYSVIIQYNYGNNAYTDGRTGSCFFFHVSTGSPTAGCVSVPLSYMKWAMGWLNGTDTKMLIY